VASLSVSRSASSALLRSRASNTSTSRSPPVNVATCGVACLTDSFNQQLELIQARLGRQ
jgi:hypothetical protein